MIEFVVGLFAILILLSALLQIVNLASMRSELMAEVRGDAGNRAMTPGAPIALPQYLLTWSPGADGRRYTADDQPIHDMPEGLRTRIVARSVADPADWHWIDQRNNRDLAMLMDDGIWSAGMGFVRAEASRTVPVVPAFRNWVYGKDSIRVSDEVWLPRLGDLY